MKGKKHPTERTGRNPQLAKTAPNTAKEPAPHKSLQPKKPSLMTSLSGIPRRAFRKFKRLNRHTQLIIILAVILIIVGFLALILGRNNQPDITNSETVEIEQTESKEARITRIDGTLQLKNEDGEWDDVRLDEKLGESAVVRTVGATSRSVLTFEDESELRIDANSELELVTITDSRIVIKQVSGYSYSRLTDVSNRVYVVESDDAQYEALGTAFRVIASGDEQAVEVYQSSVLETNTNKRPAEGEKLIVLSRARPNESNTIVKLDIETVKRDPFMQWNRTLDQASELFKNNLGFLKDFDAPEISIVSPSDNEVILLEPDAQEGTVEIRGKTERGTTLTVQSKSQAGSQPITVTVDSSGDFLTPVLTAPLGTSVFSFVVKDRAGNTSELSVRYTFQRKSAPLVTGSLLLKGELKGNKIELSWTASGGLMLPDGVQLVYGLSRSPAYGSSTAVAVKGNSRSIDISDLESDKTYYFRVCVYNKNTDTCTNYSNEVSIEL